MAKLSALVASKDLDVFMADQENTDHYASMDGLADLKQLLPQDMLSVLESRLGFSPDSAGQPVAVSLDISRTAFADAMHLSENACNLSIISNSTHTDTAIALIRYIFDL